jgi:hypothetical protein
VKRDPRLHGLSSDHHHALVLVWRLRNQMTDAAAAQRLLHETRETFERDLLRHFEIEERLLLPALRSGGEGALADRTEREHAAIRGAIAAIDGQDPAEGLRRFATLLHDHVRFEEGELFVASERVVPGDILDRLAEIAPKSILRLTGE